MHAWRQAKVPRLRAEDWLRVSSRSSEASLRSLRVLRLPGGTVRSCLSVVFVRLTFDRCPPVLSHSCLKIIMGNPPGPGDHHGCPYRHYDEEHLSNLLTQVTSHQDDLTSRSRAQERRLHRRIGWNSY